MRTVVTGGAGFIGSHLVERMLADGASEVVIIDDFNDFYDPQIKRANVGDFAERVRIIEGDIRNPEAVAAAFVEPVDRIVHLAARAGVRPSINNPGLYITTNIDGTYQLLEAARRHRVPRFIFASSSSVYGLNKKVPFAENDLIQETISPYASTKLAGEQLCCNYSHLFGIHTTCLRFFTVYGPRQRPDLAIAKFVRRVLENRPIQRYGDGTTGRDYTYVDDIVEGIMGAMSLDDGGFDIFNLGGNRTVVLNELIETIEKVTGKSAEIEEMPDQPGDVPQTSADISKAHSAFGYAPSTSLENGITNYAAWFQQEGPGRMWGAV